MRVALLGTRGIPANYGGFETFAEQLSVRLARRGHKVTVYCRANNIGTGERVYQGVRLEILPTISHKYLDTIAHTFLSTLHVLPRLNSHDVLLYCNGANAVFTAIPRLLGTPTVLNVDGLERKRKKWNAAARAWYRLSERLSTRLPTELVTDAEVIQRYYSERYRKASHFIAYGAKRGKVPSRDALDRFGLQSGEYYLYVSRMEPENNPLLVVRAFEQARVDKKLVMVGDAPYAADYIREVKRTDDPRIVFTGAVYGRGYDELQSHCAAYIHATEVGGTHPALIEAMGRGAPVLFLETPENVEVAGDVGRVFLKDADGLARLIERIDAMPANGLQEMGRRGLEAARERYDWERVVDRYEELLERTAGARSSRSARPR